ncbi:hypothetical protein [Sphingobacterium multivorum]|uniref:hypothetical protein n=1 Tax=Sphingobacterium multivorum TaxID=28454 RepID=UPI0031B9C2BF
MEKKNIIQLDFYTSYNQFYLADSEHVDSDKELWSSTTMNERLSMDKGLIAVSTQSYGPIKGELDILEKKGKDEDFSVYDHVVEGKLDLPTGVLQVQDCPNSAVEEEVIVKPGLYSVRVYSKGLDTVVGDEGDDYYRIVIWPAEDTDMRVKVLKQYNP